MIDDMSQDNYIKYLTVGKVKELLSSLDNTLILSCNEHHNLQIYDGETKNTLGFINFAGKES